LFLKGDPIDPIYKWLLIENYFVSIKISSTKLVFELIINEFLLSNEVSWAYLNAYKRILSWQPFLNMVYAVWKHIRNKL